MENMSHAKAQRRKVNQNEKEDTHDGFPPVDRLGMSQLCVFAPLRESNKLLRSTLVVLSLFHFFLFSLCLCVSAHSVILYEPFRLR